ncbi:glutathionylspermidine synthase family protein [Syntrophorhabdus aromaticivorans]|uniref:glutathionylspermidine synthase family protein n=1 Tax=Syntrophorhabdus aromaticivorans TaxID=328301 RepID=UPI003BF99B39
MYQKYCELPSFSGNYPAIGSWIIGSQSAGMGARERVSSRTGLPAQNAGFLWQVPRAIPQGVHRRGQSVCGQQARRAALEADVPAWPGRDSY